MSALDLLEIKNQITSLQRQLKENPISPEDENRFKTKIYLDWNYHSNKLEGNKLTHGETKELLLHDKTADSKPYKDHQEIKGHNEALIGIDEIIKAKDPLTQCLIRQLHKLILGKPYYVKAQTPDGQPTTRKIEIGQYKTVPNHVLTKSGEIFHFATPEETPAEMHKLMNWYEEEKGKDTNDPWFLAATFHYKFIRIHPFDDGNGRMARLLMNLILMEFDLPPLVIKEKEDYLDALRQADTGKIEAFIKYIVQQVVESLKLKLRAAKGEEIDDENDLDKQLALLKANLAQAEKVKLKRSHQVTHDFYNTSIKPFFEELTKQYLKFFDLFHSASITYSTNTLSAVESLARLDEEILELYEDTELAIKADKQPGRGELDRFIIKFKGQGFTRAGIDAFNIYKDLEFILEDFGSI